MRFPPNRGGFAKLHGSLSCGKNQTGRQNRDADRIYFWQIQKKAVSTLPFLFLSPSTQEFNPYITTGNEEYWMNQVADAMEPYLQAAAVNTTRNDPSLNAAAAIRASNAGTYDFHLALHSNAAPASLSGTLQGTDVYYFPTSLRGLRMANLIVDNLRQVYPDPDRVRALATTSIGEVSRTQAPAVLVELAYHDNLEDAVWITGNVDAIARSLSMAVTEYFGLPFLEPRAQQSGRVNASGGLALRQYPSAASAPYLTIPEGTGLTVYNSYDGWYVTGYNGVLGYADAAGITLV